MEIVIEECLSFYQQIERKKLFVYLVSDLSDN